MNVHSDILGLIGNTPLVKINNITRQHGIKAQVYAKMESLNPGYSVKDRIGVSMINDAEEKGILRPGGTLIEATSGNTGIGMVFCQIVFTGIADNKNDQPVFVQLSCDLQRGGENRSG